MNAEENKKHTSQLAHFYRFNETNKKVNNYTKFFLSTLLYLKYTIRSLKKAEKLQITGREQLHENELKIYKELMWAGVIHSWPDNYVLKRLNLPQKVPWRDFRARSRQGYQFHDTLGYVQTRNAESCLQICLNQTKCRAVNYLKSIRWCVLLASASVDMKIEPGAVYNFSQHIFFVDGLHRRICTYFQIFVKLKLVFLLKVNLFQVILLKSNAFLYIVIEVLVICPFLESKKLQKPALDPKMVPKHPGMPFFPPEQEKRTIRKSRIVGGSLSKPYSFPYVVRLKRFDNQTVAYCSGCLLQDVIGETIRDNSSRFVVTAAHCVFDE